MICANNVNRSTEAHDHLFAAGLRVCSYGAGNKVRFPGPTRYDPRIYDFQTPYVQMYEELKAENEELFTRNGVLSMLKRDIITKRAPQRWQDATMKEINSLDVIICFEERIYDIVLEDIQLRSPNEFKPLHVICLDIKDTPEHAKIGGQLALSLCHSLNHVENHSQALSKKIEIWQDENGIKLHYSLIFL